MHPFQLRFTESCLIQRRIAISYLYLLQCFITTVPQPVTLTELMDNSPNYFWNNTREGDGMEVADQYALLMLM